ncbi:MAG: ASCH domain-containing protein [Scytonematopsis contorta HA4267-MV1]|jgi:predicted transcriptional regulator|nr:ASCH domain-containing protein [Scytonematopsis contorta HA4267-MV1]
MLVNILLLSIKPEYADKIFSGNKTVELRRVRTRLNTGDLVLVYVSSPKKALVGKFEVESISQIKLEESENDLNQFWHQVKDKAGVTSKEFESYYEGASMVVGIFLKNVERFSMPINLELLREKFPKFYPPQSYRYLKESEMQILESIMEESVV